MSYEKATILSYLRKIHDKELVLPAIQRDFVWDEDHINRLLDSIFRGYPFGTLLFWNTKQRVQFRRFTLEWSEDERYTYDIKPEGQKTTLVLDGQQRLQSLYVALYGSLDNKRLYFDLLSGDEPDDISQAKFIFQFLTATQAEEENQKNMGAVYWVQLNEITNIEKQGQIIVKVQQYLRNIGLAAESDEGARLSQNVGIAYYTIKADEVLNFYTVDKEFGDDGLLTSQDEILEIFVRVNSGGQVLTKSDLMFSLMQLSWEGAADAIADLVEKLNKKGRYNFDKDFILKCALVCVGEGAKYAVAKFRKESTLEKIENEFHLLDRALENCVDFVVNTSRFLDDRILRSYNTLIPFVYFFYLQPDQDIHGEDVRIHMNQALYLSLMTSVYSRFADNYIDQVINNILNPEHKIQPGVFPLGRYRRFVYEKREKATIDDWLLQNNIPLLMNILEKGRRLPEGRRRRVPEYDHIFPKSKLPDYGYLDELINHYANMRLIPAKDNNWKRNQDPNVYFERFPEVMDYYLMPTGLLEYEQYPEFIKLRSKLIWKIVRTFLGLPKEPETIPPAYPLPESSASKPVQVTKDDGGSVIDETSLMRRMLTRAPISRGQRALYEVLYKTGDKGLTNHEIIEAMSLNPPQLPGVLGALGRRIEYTEGSKQFGGIGIGLVFEISRTDDGWHYRLRPAFRKVLEDEGIM
ncbi:DUF262 domain-containing protein [Chloroflexota bacterium]